MNKGVIKIVSLLVVLLVVGAWMYRKQAFRPSPKEADRYSHPAGFSLVLPQGWFAEIDLGATPQIRMYPKEQVGPQISMFVKRISGDKPDTSARDWSDGSFQNQPARVYQKVERKMIGYRVVFERNGESYQLSALTPEAEPASGGWLRPFLESFRVERSSTAPSTQSFVLPE